LGGDFQGNTTRHKARSSLFPDGMKRSSPLRAFRYFTVGYASSVETIECRTTVRLL